MRAKKIAEELLARQIKISKNILLDINILSEVLFWARESAREYFSSEVNKLFLVSYIDDVAPWAIAVGDHRNYFIGFAIQIKTIDVVSG